ncbi:uncharacterized protein LOC122388848 [Amphibalanus amphitrite]|uniref:uncharacterized protein LOC122364699 n=1 Tax=Amphibalanus amphitrite TaxID=1232801 RepID=UPI001C928B5D|nr:uncharacterized protein LOC122364699 [Amphibalanus amphitrite]XP_043191275.1 uncharacterized protein LOC122364699 [Amphibalanus amphitrite]XP_043191276.1 uncharacterized protein LOC122364699 [Amphibalanus amphitrite]XP_043191278.1 uncharacterized protein LOC122364699 [Amphibalanus amphitrite]XP_043236252.1 uncharacterized protein LOC122388848 [Amphibalanus amphitrite]
MAVAGGVRRWQVPAACALVYLCAVAAQFDWQTQDNFDMIDQKFKRVRAENCELLPFPELFMPEDAVSHKPDIKEININPVLPNRTHMLYLHNLVLSRGYFYSYVIQSRYKRPTQEGKDQSELDPGMMYYFLSVVADLSSSPYINASAIYFAPNTSYSPSFTSNFNQTFPLFAPRAFRADDYNYPFHLERISTLNTFEVSDLGAFEKIRQSKNYTKEEYRINRWYYKWLPDRRQTQASKTTYTVKIRYANNTNDTYTFHGPPAADETPGPVNWTQPYFDCGRSNKWIMGAAVPIVDLYHRHTGFRHIEYPTYTAVAVIEMDFERIDINQCPLGEGNLGPNHFADTARCKKDTTECEPLDGYGFRRGGYQCRCKPGHRLPNVVRRPYLGEVLERATSEQYRYAFHCDNIGWIQKTIVGKERLDQYTRMQHMHRHFYKNHTAHLNDSLAQPPVEDVMSLLEFMQEVKAGDCTKYHPKDLQLRGDVTYGADKQMENQARLALRLANFISAFLQVSDPDEVFSGKRLADRPLTEDQMMGEAVSLLMGDTWIWNAGIYWDRNKFFNRTLFAPFAYKEKLNTRAFKMEDLARVNKSEDVYLNKPVFRAVKARWSTNFDSLEKIWIKMLFRSHSTSDNLFLRKYTRYPDYFLAAKLEDGYWTAPYFDCGGFHPMWMITYAAPFFGWDDLKHSVEFKGMVSVSMSAENLDINQCDHDYWVANAFKNTHKCDRRSSYCVPIQGRGFWTGGYKCDCKQGYEYPFEDPITYFDGQLVEAEFLNLVKDEPTRFDYYKCRLAGADRSQISFVVLVVLLAAAGLYRRLQG